jgi:hypothetical protein
MAAMIKKPVAAKIETHVPEKPFTLQAASRLASTNVVAGNNNLDVIDGRVR